MKDPEKKKMQRTSQQNRALHKYLGMLADRFNDAGLDMKKVLKPEVDIAWTTENAKKYIWKPIQKALLNKDHTADLSTDEVTQVYETINRHVAEKFGITEPFPSIEELMHSSIREEEVL